MNSKCTDEKTRTLERHKGAAPKPSDQTNSYALQ
jgi:hypothetical protein